MQHMIIILNMVAMHLLNWRWLNIWRNQCTPFFMCTLAMDWTIWLNKGEDLTMISINLVHNLITILFIILFIITLLLSMGSKICGVKGTHADMIVRFWMCAVILTPSWICVHDCKNKHIVWCSNWITSLIVANDKQITSYVDRIRVQRRIFERILIFGGHLGFLRLYKIAQTFASGTQRIWIQQVEIM